MLINCLKHYPLSLLTVLAILLLSLLPIGSIEMAEDVPFFDKWTHMVMYACLALVIVWEYTRRHRPVSLVRLFLWGLLFPIALGGIVELLQAYATTYRSGEWLDWAADAVGAFIAFILTRLLSLRHRVDF